MKYILQCPRCSSIKDWDNENAGPGHCECGAYAYWKVLKERPNYKKGFVIVHSHLGKQELHGPDFQEDPNAWEKD